MQPIKKIIKAIQLPVWLWWGAAMLALVASAIGAMHGSTAEVKAFSAVGVTTGLVFFLVTMGQVFYFANDSIGRRKEQDQKMTQWRKEMAAIKTFWDKEEAERAPDLDRHL